MPPSRPINRAQALAVMRQHQKRQKAMALGRQALAHGARVNALGARAIQMELERQRRIIALGPDFNWWRKEPSADGSQSVTGQSGNDQLQDGSQPASDSRGNDNVKPYSQIEVKGDQIKLIYSLEGESSKAYEIAGRLNFKTAENLTVSSQNKLTIISGQISVAWSDVELESDEIEEYLLKATEAWNNILDVDPDGHKFQANIISAPRRMSPFESRQKKDEFLAERCRSCLSKEDNALGKGGPGRFLLSYDSRLDTVQIAGHEAGHTFGLRHNTDPGSLMYKDTTGASRPKWPELKLLAHMYGR